LSIFFTLFPSTQNQNHEPGSRNLEALFGFESATTAFEQSPSPGKRLASKLDNEWYGIIGADCEWVA